ncbi:hypothetical protein FGG08_003802 [Glutinoglossum americanum]|uniref:Major facilitator superfamily (MFS) profile domain-containing protein n=1 Tax=Glutinoglossum americanum TaxID=1670608 RepID=A0A9P8I1P8_9PEZI|nr:hypothetical protein FGG08_003802 [Glutinoglossum americanum]
MGESAGLSVREGSVEVEVDGEGGRRVASQPDPEKHPTILPIPGNDDDDDDDDTPQQPPTHYPELHPPLPSLLLLLGSFSALLASLGTMNSIGAFQSYLSAHQLSRHSPQAVGWIFGVYVFLAFGGGVVVGGVFDKVGPRGLVAGGTVGVLGALGGVGGCTGGSIGGILFPLLLDSLIPRIGFSWSTRVMALLALFLLTLANLLIRSRLPPKPASSALPNLRPFSNPTFAVTSIGVYMIEWGIFIPLTYLPSYALAHGIPSTVALKLLAIFNAASFFGRWGPGFVADKVGRFNMMLVMVGACLGSTMGIWYFAAGRTGEVVAYAVIFGFASGSNITLTPVCVGQLCETEEYGRHYAATYTLVSFG